METTVLVAPYWLLKEECEKSVSGKESLAPELDTTIASTLPKMAHQPEFGPGNMKFGLVIP
jgi:hypothetical protein